LPRKLRNIWPATSRKSGIIDDILDFSKIEAGKLVIEKRPFRFEELFESISAIAATRIGDKPVEFLYDFSADIPQRLIGDAHRISQILTNLVSNAIKFTERGSIVVAARVIRKTGRQLWLRFEVRDTGIGIPEGKIDRLFEAFTQADGSTTRRFGGTGLGLSISRRLAELMGGSISAESKEGRGSLFRVDLPLERVESNGVLQVDPDLRNRNILLVEDDPTTQAVIADMLRSLTHRVTAVTTAGEAMKQLAGANPPFDLMLVDWRLPDKDGDELVRMVDEKYGEQRPRIILITAYGPTGGLCRKQDSAAGYWWPRTTKSTARWLSSCCNRWAWRWRR